MKSSKILNTLALILIVSFTVLSIRSLMVMDIQSFIRYALISFLPNLIFMITIANQIPGLQDRVPEAEDIPKSVQLGYLVVMVVIGLLLMLVTEVMKNQVVGWILVILLFIIIGALIFFMQNIVDVIDNFDTMKKPEISEEFDDEPEQPQPQPQPNAYTINQINPTQELDDMEFVTPGSLSEGLDDIDESNFI